MKLSLYNFISTNSFSDISRVKDDTLIFRDGYFDSMGFMSLITFLEDELQVPVLDNDLTEDNFESVNAILKFIERKHSF